MSAHRRQIYFDPAAVRIVGNRACQGCAEIPPKPSYPTIADLLFTRLTNLPASCELPAFMENMKGFQKRPENNQLVTLYAATDGNHERAVAFMAKVLQISAEIYVPRFLDGATH
ncbi:hypothetical protein PAAG_11654 [Paracoccidioides lutzii Pb01]|uniref:Uncharacterized protein n=1 Tax=Paracoccidioides lutzii (strain ATCC MYA-826 / Pb01) TaxID=502779 RepID=A0A0A2V5T5_PARBA|nr:hypothetical protein PAAG_11654 [Paracoccidioides lutzii Pb01]KGQ01662.1 hypothetical protein PAAG_11654 [Paracoccidioides lutzii Pb01]